MFTNFVCFDDGKTQMTWDIERNPLIIRVWKLVSGGTDRVQKADIFIPAYYDEVATRDRSPYNIVQDVAALYHEGLDLNPDRDTIKSICEEDGYAF